MALDGEAKLERGGATGTASPNEALLLFSDVHLGSDLNDSGKSVPRSKAIDNDLAAMLAHYREAPPPSPAERWRVVIVGDFIDFIGISIDPTKDDAHLVETELTRAEREFGLGGAEDHVLLKLRRTAKRHANVFSELSAFINAGHRITIIHGNHDLELHWPRVQKEFRALLSATDDEHVDFTPWFVHREGLAFIEHGHQYDPFCSTPFILAPLCPRDPKRINPTLSDSLLRHIVRRTPGMKEYGHENRGLASYISWGLMLGARGTIDLFRRFFFIVLELRSIARAYASETGKRLRDDHDERLATLSRTTNIPVTRLRAALALHIPSLGLTPRGVLTSVIVDRMLVMFTMVLLLIAVASFWSRLDPYGIPIVVTLLTIWVTTHIIFSRGRPTVDPTAVMERSAGELSKLFPSSFIVMGHTHVPMTKTLGGGDATYINLGSWAEEEPDPKENAAGKAYRAARTHLVIVAKNDRHEARLCEWHDGAPREKTLTTREIGPSRAPAVVVDAATTASAAE